MENIAEQFKKINKQFETSHNDVNIISKKAEKYLSELLHDLPIEYSKMTVTFVSLSCLSELVVRMLLKIEIFSETDAKELLKVLMKDAEEMLRVCKNESKKSD